MSYSYWTPHRKFDDPPDPPERPPPKSNEPSATPGLDASLLTAENGQPIPIVFGTHRVDGNIVERYAYKFNSTGSVDRQKSTAYNLGDYVKNQGNVYVSVAVGTNVSGTGDGPSGTGSGQVDGNVTWDYVAMGFKHYAAIAFCEGLIYGAGKAWQDKNEFADWSQIPHDTFWLTLNLGTASGGRVTPSWFPIQTDVYGNTAVLFGAFRSGADADLPVTTLEIKGLFADATHVDANPADIVSTLLTHVRCGAGWPSGRVDSDPTTGTLGNLASGYRKYCTAFGFNVSWNIDTQTSALELIKQLLGGTNTDAVMTNRADGLGMMMKFVPLGDQALTANGVTFTPVTTAAYSLTLDDLLKDSTVEIDTVPATETYNSFPIEYIDRATAYKRLTVDDPDMSDVDIRGLVRANATSLPYIISPDTAIQLSRIKAQRDLNVLNTYRLALPYRFLLLEPTDLLTYTDSVLGFSNRPMRITAFEEDQSGDGSIRIEAEDFPTAVGAAASYTPQTNDGFKPAVSTALAALTILPGQAPTSVVPDSTSTRGAMIDNIFPGGTSETSPPDGVDTTKPEWAGRVNAGTSAFAGSWVRQLTALQNARQLLGDQPPISYPPSYQSQLGLRVPCAPGETFYIEAMVRWAQGAAGQNGGVYMYFVNAAGDTVIGGPTTFTQVAAPTLQDFDSLLTNGGGETGTVGAQATGWTLLGGNGLLVANDFALFGTKSLKITNAVAADSFSYQDFAVVGGQEYVLSGWIKTTALPTADAGTCAALNIDTVSGVTGFTILEKVGFDPNAAQPDVGVAADGVIHDWTFVKCRFKPIGSGTLRLHCQLGYGGTQSGTAWFDGVQLNTNYTKSQAYGVAPAGAVAVHFFVWADSNLGAITVYFDAIYARRQVDAGVVAKLGGYFVDEVQYASLTAIGRLTSGTWPNTSVDRAWYRGNCDLLTLGGAPNIARLTLTAEAWDTTLKMGRLTLALSPQAATDNLDGMRYAVVDVYRQSLRGTTGTLTLVCRVYVALTDRLYRTPGTDSSSNNLVVTQAHVVDTAISSGFPAALVTIYNVNGPSDTNCFYSNSTWVAGNSLTNNGQAWPAGLTGGTGGGGGGGGSGGGGCLDPETPVLVGPTLLVPLHTVRAGDLLWTRHEDGGEMGYHAVESATVTTNLRCRVELADGRHFTCSVNHLLNVRGIWRRADSLQGGEEIQGDPSGHVRSVSYLGEGPVVQLRIPTAQTYFAGDGCWHHNILKP